MPAGKKSLSLAAVNDPTGSRRLALPLTAHIIP
jgi:hypothetical protein